MSVGQDQSNTMKIAILGGHYLKNLCQTENIWSCNLPLSINPVADNSVQTLLAEQCPFPPDLLLFADQSCLPMLTGLEDLDIPVAAYLVDTHLHYGWHRHFAGLFDKVFAAQQNATVSLKRYTADCQWLPLFSSDGDLKQDCAKKYDVVFVGTVEQGLNSERVRFLEAFAQQMPLLVTSGDYREPFNSARIILNQSVRNDINFRVFEALASGSMLLTDDVGNGLEELFEDGQHLVTYRKGDVDDAVAKAHYYLEHAQQREEIAAAGHLCVIAKHTLAIRSGELLREMERMQSQLSVQAFSTVSERNYAKKLAAGRTYLAISLLMTDLEALHGNGYYGRRVEWYLHLAENTFRQILDMYWANDQIIKDLALLDFLRKDLAKAMMYCKIALLDTPDDVECLLLAARIMGARGDMKAGRSLYNKGAVQIRQLAETSGNSLLCEHLATSAQFARRCL